MVTWNYAYVSICIPSVALEMVLIKFCIAISCVCMVSFTIAIPTDCCNFAALKFILADAIDSTISNSSFLWES